MNPLYYAVIAAVLGRQRRCAACGKVQIVDHIDRDGRYHCKKCRHAFTKKELKTRPGARY